MPYAWPDFRLPPINLWTVPAQPFAPWHLRSSEPPRREPDPALLHSRQAALRSLSEARIRAARDR